MKFKNTTGKMKIVRFGSNLFRDVLPGDVVDLPKQHGINHGFSFVRDGVELKDEVEETVEVEEEPKPEKPKKEDKEKEEDFKDWLLDLKGIGPKVVKDVIKDYKSKDELRIAYVSGEHIQLRDDKVEILRKALGV